MPNKVIAIIVDSCSRCPLCTPNMDCAVLDISVESKDDAVHEKCPFKDYEPDKPFQKVAEEETVDCNDYYTMWLG